MTAAEKRAADRLLNRTADTLRDLRRDFPGQRYAARLYRCAWCVTIDAAVAPTDELPDDYPCPACGRAQTPLTDASEHVARPNRAQRRARR